MLRRAVESIGKKELAARLGVTQGVLDGWLTGYLLMPDRKLVALAAVMKKLDNGKK